MSDARFEDGGEKPLYLAARDAEDLQVLSSLVQDAVLTAGDISWQKGRRRLALLLNRFRWEDHKAAQVARRPYERVRALLVVEGALSVRTQGIARDDREMVLSLLSVAFEPGEDGAGRVVLTLAGDGALAIEVEALEVTLKDVTRPYAAASRKPPEHPA
ncbi:hypothetical protein U879_15695 [Defluviimonas sp. 20V17]|uniref:DUF2948 family protein n=1 Tax=Allgaiera indica TaxID=765699 RepID=A0AAN4ZXM6_9RHOB|nr:DUF2948 family protein [Allgaiera indica]KDB02755.1 hypothetical protein U879_15695 [Defluviimonas sp. 20V17]GHD98731.1 hypothetical protein GCM10008024_03420 [Allgaiera indica]SDW07453.1 Protein of unknown function [Allgaiera indica]